MRTPTASRLLSMQVLVSDESPMDAAILRPVGREPLVILRRFQSFSNAVAQMSALMPSEHPDDVRLFIRRNLPDAEDFDRLLSNALPLSWLDSDTPQERPSRPRRALRYVPWAAGGSVVALAVVGYALAATVTPPSMELVAGEAFQRVATAADFKCDALDYDDAACMDLTGGATMFVTAHEGNQLEAPDTFLFSSGDENAKLFLFESSEHIDRWHGLEATKARWPILIVQGRFLTAATSEEAARRFTDAVAEVDPAQAAQTRRISPEPPKSDQVHALPGSVPARPLDVPHHAAASAKHHPEPQAVTVAARKPKGDEKGRGVQSRAEAPKPVAAPAIEVVAAVYRPEAGPQTRAEVKAAWAAEKKAGKSRGGAKAGSAKPQTRAEAKAAQKARTVRV